MTFSYIFFFLCILTYIDYSFRAIFQIDADAEIDEVIDGITHLAKLVHRLLPIKFAFIPVVAFQYRPPTKIF